MEYVERFANVVSGLTNANFTLQLPLDGADFNLVRGNILSV